MKHYPLKYTRRRVPRAIARGLGRLVLPAAFRLRITGRTNFPKRGPLVVVGNHVAAMDAPLMAVYAPWQVELVGAADIPHEKITEVAMWFLGFIPVRRGHVDRPAMNRRAMCFAMKGATNAPRTTWAHQC